MLMVSSSKSDTNNNNNSIITINNNNTNNIKCYNNIKCRTMYEPEIPCRDTDPDPAMAEERDDSDQLNRASPMAFTIDFGLGENTPEKAKKMERFALRSSLRKPRSPRTEPKQTDNQDKCSSPLQNGVLGLVKSSAVKSKNALTKTVTNGSDAASCTTKEVVKRKVSGSALVSPTTAANRRLTTVISPGSEFTNFAQEARKMSEPPRKMSEPPRSERENPGRGSQSQTRATDSSAFNRRLTTTISPEDSKIFVEQVQCKIESLEIVENYDEDSFEPDDNDSEDDHRNFEKFLNDDSSLSETGTYTIDKDKEEKGVKDARNDLETLVGPNDGSYVSDWANQHRNSRGEDLNISMSSSKGSDGSRARRKLPPTPGAQPARSPDALNFSPDSGESGSGMTPPEMQDSDEGETSFMKHTQHLVDVMEARISKQETSTKSSHGKTILAKSSSSVSKTKTTATRVTGSNGVIQHTTNTTYTRDKEQEKNPMEAWKRRKNYDPLAAAGKKKEAKGRINELTRKSSSPCLDTRNSSSSSSPRDSAPLSSLRIDDFDDEDPTTSVDHTTTTSKATASLTRGTQPPLIRGPVAGRSGLSQGRRPAPAPANSQTKSGSDSSGYFSRNDGGRFSLRTKTVTENVATRSNAPDRPSSSRSPHLKKLVQSNSSLKKSSTGNRSNSSLTSKEAEFQAWKRRKNYNPLKSAAGARKSTSPSSSGPVAPSKSAYSPSPTGHASHNGHAPHSGHAPSQSHAPLSGHAPHSGHAPRSGHAPLSGHAPSKHFHHSRIRDMTQSLMFESSDESVPMQRSMSFHYPDPMGRVVTSEDESNDDYGSGCDSARSGGGSQPRSYPHYYLDEDELILPIYPQGSQPRIKEISGSQARINEISASLANKSLSPKISPSRSRSKLEALDNLVISTIYSVSSKLCGTSAHLIRQAGDAYPPTDEDQAATLETVLYLLDDVDLPSSPAKKTSRELSGTLRNLKKVEQALEVLSKIVCDDS